MLFVEIYSLAYYQERRLLNAVPLLFLLPMSSAVPVTLILSLSCPLSRCAVRCGRIGNAILEPCGKLPSDTARYEVFEPFVSFGPPNDCSRYCVKMST